MSTTIAPPPGSTMVEDTVLNHAPLTVVNDEGKTILRLESWSIFDIVYRLRDKPAPYNGLAYLQPDQSIKVWERTKVGEPWAICAELGIRAVSALVMAGRLMLDGGTNKLSSHPKISAWDISDPLFGRASQLRPPGLLRDFRVTYPPGQHVVPGLVVHDKSQLDARHIGATTFMQRCHRSPLPGCCEHHNGVDSIATITARKSTDPYLLPGCPLSVAAPASDKTPCRPADEIMTYDVGTSDVAVLCRLPLPQVLSGLEGDSADDKPGILSGYDDTWKKLQLEYLDKIEATELYVYRSCPAQGSRIKPDYEGGLPILVNPPEGLKQPVSAFVPEVYRNPMSFLVNGVCPDLGDVTLDYRLYERMLPFSGQYLDESILLQ